MRINIEDSLLAKPWFLALCRICGSPELAVGKLYFLWRRAQELHPEPIPLYEFNAFFDKDLIQAGCVNKVEFGYTVKGANDCFNWILGRAEAGKKGGLARASKAKQGQARPSTPQAGKPLSLSLSLPLPRDQEKELNTFALSCETAASVPPPPLPPSKRIRLNMQNWEWEGFIEEDVPRLKEAYPGVDIPTQLAQAAQHIMADPKRKKTDGGWYRYITNWLKNAQNGRFSRRFQ